MFILLILAMALSVSTLASAKENASALARGDAKSYIVVMMDDPIVAYQGQITGYEATRPGKGQKVNPNSAKVRKYEMFLKKRHNDSLAAAGVPATAKVHNYTFALNGYSAILTEDEVKALKAKLGL
jgi:hypothetical protein